MSLGTLERKYLGVNGVAKSIHNLDRCAGLCPSAEYVQFLPTNAADTEAPTEKRGNGGFNCSNSCKGIVESLEAASTKMKSGPEESGGEWEIS